MHPLQAQSRKQLLFFLMLKKDCKKQQTTPKADYILMHHLQIIIFLIH